MRRISIVLGAIALLVGVMPITATAAPSPYFVDETKLPFDAIPGFEDANRLWGVHKGAGYRIEVPANWNGSLVMWAHGFRGTGLELTVDNHPLRDYLIPNGFAWAASSYTKNDYNVQAGAEDTKKLREFFERRVATPDQVYTTGESMGGHITATSIERWPHDYVGAMPICGVLGDLENFDFYLDFNVAAQQIALDDSTFPVDPAYPVTTALDIKAALELAPGTWPADLNSDGEAFRQLVELRSGGDRPNFDEAWFFWNSIPEFGSGIPGNFLFDLGAGDGTLPGRRGVAVDNTDVVYQTDLDPAISAFEADLNADIVRIKADADARRRKGGKNPAPLTGKFEVPVLSLHNLGVFVAFHNELAYHADAVAAGSDHLLVQRAIRGVGHCDFTSLELVQALAELTAWVDFGVKPAGDDFGNPAAIADPDFGCAFTNDPFNEHILATPCP